MKMEKNFVTYEEFGAVGDGVTDDMPAIVACHAYANEHGLDVVGREGANYYIGGKDLTAVIKTNVRWGSARFTVDDRNLERITQSCFHVAPDGERFTPAIASLRRGQERVEFPHEGNVYVRVYNQNRSVYIRKGLNQNNGTPASDCFAVDAKGNVTGSINWDYDTVTDAYAISTDDPPIVIEGGIFTTIANNQPSFYRYHDRNISINRSHVTVCGLTHYIEGEGDQGAPYSGFLDVEETLDVTLEDCLMTAHKTYWTASKIPGQQVPMGSYDISVTAVIGMRLIRVRQTTDITDKRYWGLMGSNFAKEFLMEDCEMSRFDAHMGVTNGCIRRCRLGYMGVNLIGFGEFWIEKSTFLCDRTVSFRSDYGSFFHGTLTMKNCIWVPTVGEGKKTAEILHARNEGDHDFGYECGMPRTMVIDGLVIDDRHLTHDGLIYSLFPNYDKDFSPNKPYPYGTPKHVIAKGIRALSGREIHAFVNPLQYPALSEFTLD